MTSPTKSFKIVAAIWLALFLQFAIWYALHSKVPSVAIVTPPPTKLQAKAVSLGDEQSYFRFLAMQLQTMGDSWGEFRALREYNYELLSKWFYLMDELDSKSNFVPSIASYYYSNTQTPQDNIHIVKYLENHYDNNPMDKWWWLSQAVYIANHKMQDKDLALNLAKKLSKTEAKIPYWVRQMPAIIYEQLGEKEESFLIIKNIAENYHDFSEGERNFMKYFIEERLGFLNRELVETKDNH